jgi:hypothetical protein
MKMIAGRIDSFLAPAPLALPFVRDASARIGRQHGGTVATIPNVPTLCRSGFPQC